MVVAPTEEVVVGADATEEEKEAAGIEMGGEAEGLGIAVASSRHQWSKFGNTGAREHDEEEIDGYTRAPAPQQQNATRPRPATRYSVVVVDVLEDSPPPPPTWTWLGAQVASSPRPFPSPTASRWRERAAGCA